MGAGRSLFSFLLVVALAIWHGDGDGMQHSSSRAAAASTAAAAAAWASAQRQAANNYVNHHRGATYLSLPLWFPRFFIRKLAWAADAPPPARPACRPSCLALHLHLHAEASSSSAGMRVFLGERIVFVPGAATRAGLSFPPSSSTVVVFLLAIGHSAIAAPPRPQGRKKCSPQPS
jgi:hypothetical protein